MGALVTYSLVGSVATLTMDDGKKNALSLAMLNELNAAFDRAEADRAAVVLTGREGVLSAGFDLPTLAAGGAGALAMVRAGFELSARMLSYPMPVVVACGGHAIAMGVFLLLSGDYRIGASGAYKFQANEVALGLTIPHAAVEVCRQRLTPAHLQRTVLLSETYSPETAVEAGFLDRTVALSEVLTISQHTAEGLMKLNVHAHTASKQRLRGPVLDALKAAIERDAQDLQKLWAS
jgi:enoyl-CoA hydratase